MRVLVLDTYYPAFVEAHYREHDGLAERPYSEQLESLMEQCFGTSDAYSRHLRELGHDAIEVVANCAPLQRRWAKENGVRGRRRLGLAERAGRRGGARPEEELLHRTLAAQIESFDPDVVYAQDLSFLSPDEQREISTSRLLAGQIAIGLPPPEQIRGYELLLTSFPHFVERFRAGGIDSEYFRIGFYERVNERLRARGIDPAAGSERPHAAVFVGGLDPAVHGEGVRMLEALSEGVELEVWGYGAEPLPESSPLRALHRGEAWGIGMYEVFAASRVVVNRHIAAAEGHANNMRLFEATGTGALLLTETAPNLGDMFQPGREVVSYEGTADLVSKVRAQLADEEGRRRIAAAGQARTLSEHTYARRMAELVEILEPRVAAKGRA